MPQRTWGTRRNTTAAKAAAAAVAAALLASGCQSAVNQSDKAGRSAEASACQTGGTVVAVSAQPAIPGRVLAQGAANFFWVRGVYEPLMTTEAATLGDPKPVLATDWKISGDDHTVVLQLRRGVTFHSGRPFTSADVVDTIKLALGDTSPSDVKTILSSWKVAATGKYEVTITSANPLSPVLGSTLDLTPIVDAKTYAGVEDGTQLIGTGPFKVDAYQPGAKVVLVRNDKYWGKKASLDRIENVAIPDSTAQLSALRSGRAQLAFGMTTQDALSLTNGSAQFKLFKTNQTVYPMVLDTTQGVFTNPKARQAIGYAIDRKRIDDQVLGSLGTTNELYWATNDEGYPKDQENPYPYDPAKAKALVAAAGAAGAKVPITIINNPVLHAEYEIIAKNLTDAGLRPSLVALAAPDYQARLAAGKGGNYLSFRGLNGSPAFMVQTNADLRLQGAHRQFTSPQYQQLVQGVVQAPAGDQAAAAIDDLTKYMNGQAFLQVLAISPGIAIRDTAVQGASFGLGGFRYNNACLAAK